MEEAEGVSGDVSLPRVGPSFCQTSSPVNPSASSPGAQFHAACSVPRSEKPPERRLNLETYLKADAHTEEKSPATPPGRHNHNVGFGDFPSPFGGAHFDASLPKGDIRCLEKKCQRSGDRMQKAPSCRDPSLSVADPLRCFPRPELPAPDS